MKRNFIILFITTFLLCFISVAYAAFNSELTITGEGTVQKDTTPPTCGAWYLRDSSLTIQEAYNQNKFKNPGTNTTWTNTDKKLFIQCSDNMPGSYGCINVTEITDSNNQKRYYKEVKEYTSSIKTDGEVSVTLQDAYLNSRTCTLPAGGSKPYLDKQEPELTITQSAANKFTYSATDNFEVLGYMVTTSSTEPALDDSNWVSDPSEVTIDNTAAHTYYVWAKDGVNITHETIETFLLTKTEGTGTTLTLKYNNNSGAELTTGYVLDGTIIYVSGSVNQGFSNLEIKKNNVNINSESTQTINAATTISSSATTNIYTLTANANGGSISSTSGWTGTGDTATKSVTYDSAYGTLPTVSRTGYSFDGWYSNNVKDKEMSGGTSNYRYTEVAPLVPGTTYNVRIGSAIVTSGTASEFTSYVYDKTDTSGTSRTLHSFGTNVKFSKTCPISYDYTHDIRLLIYSGPSGSTSGVNTKYTNIYVSTNDNAAPYSSTSIVKTSGDHNIYALWTPIELVFDNKTITKTFSTSAQTITNGVDEATNGTGTYTYAITGGNSNNYFSLSGRDIVIAANTPANTTGYSVTITATDSNSGVTKAATYTIKINKATPTLNATTPQTLTYPTASTISYTYTGDGTVTCATSSSTYATCSVNTSTKKLTITPVKPNGSTTVTITLKAAAGTNYNAATNKVITVTINKGTCGKPSNVSIASNKKVTWTAGSGASSYKVCTATNTSCTPSTALTSGSVYNAITDAKGTRRVYVQSQCNTTYYSSATSSSVYGSTTVYSLSLTKGSNITQVSGGGNYITGATATILATKSANYQETSYSYTNGDSYGSYAYYKYHTYGTPTASGLTFKQNSGNQYKATVTMNDNKSYTISSTDTISKKGCQHRETNIKSFKYYNFKGCFSTGSGSGCDVTSSYWRTFGDYCVWGPYTQQNGPNIPVKDNNGTGGINAVVFRINVMNGYASVFVQTNDPQLLRYQYQFDYEYETYDNEIGINQSSSAAGRLNGSGASYSIANAFYSSLRWVNSSCP